MSKATTRLAMTQRHLSTPAPADPQVLFEAAHSLRILTLNRPGKQNVLNTEMVAQILPQLEVRSLPPSVSLRSAASSSLAARRNGKSLLSQTSSSSRAPERTFAQVEMSRVSPTVKERPRRAGADGLARQRSSRGVPRRQGNLGQGERVLPARVHHGRIHRKDEEARRVHHAGQHRQSPGPAFFRLRSDTVSTRRWVVASVSLSTLPSASPQRPLWSPCPKRVPSPPLHLSTANPLPNRPPSASSPTSAPTSSSPASTATSAPTSA